MDFILEIYRIMVFAVYLTSVFVLGYLIGREKEELKKAQQLTCNLEENKKEYDKLLVELRNVATENLKNLKNLKN